MFLNKVSNFWYIVFFSVFSALMTGAVMLWNFSNLNFESSSFENFNLSKKDDSGLCVTGKSEDELIYGKYLLKYMSGVPLKRVSKDVLIIRNIDGYEAISTDKYFRRWSRSANRWYGDFINNAIVSNTIFFADLSDDGKGLTLAAVDFNYGEQMWKKTLIETGFQGREKRVMAYSNNAELYIISSKSLFIAGCEEGPCDLYDQAVRDNAAGDVNYVYKINPKTGDVVWKKQYASKSEFVSYDNEVLDVRFEKSHLKFFAYVGDSNATPKYEFSFDLTSGEMAKIKAE